MQIEEPTPLSSVSARRFLWALFNLGTSGRPYTPEALSDAFSAGSPLAGRGVKELYDRIQKTTDPKSKTFFAQWQILFSEVCGYDLGAPGEKVNDLAALYDIRTQPDPPALLFALHTYYAILMKLIAAEVISFFHKVPSPLKRLTTTPTDGKLARELADLEDGGFFRHLNITNFLEGDLFSWYLSDWGGAIPTITRQLANELNNFNPGTLSENPTQSHDLLKRLYQNLFPRSVRHALGEFYTPDWLADHLLQTSGYLGDPRRRILDPACGSGTFLIKAIALMRKWHTENLENLDFQEGGLARYIASNVVGFDLNPIAVMAARTNFLIALRDLLPHLDHIEIPIYLADSVLTPSEFGDLFSGTLGDALEISTSACRFLIPKEITGTPEVINSYCACLEDCVKNKYTAEEFLARCQQEGLPVKHVTLHNQLYAQIRTLDEDKQDGVWARIIKNQCAPLFSGMFDFVIGNPPWIGWETLPTGYREKCAPLWQEYTLFPHKGYKAKLGHAKDDISILMTYVSHDKYLKDDGVLAFLITQSVFKTKGGGEGFRSLEYDRDGRKVFLDPVRVDDFSSFQPFEDANNRTASFVVGKSNARIVDGIEYYSWRPVKGQRVRTDDDWATVKKKLDCKKRSVEPVEPGNRTSPWLTVDAYLAETLSKLKGRSQYRARKGVYCATNAIYWIIERRAVNADQVVVKNLANSGKKSVEQVEVAVEGTFLYPLLRGKDVRAFSSAHAIWILLPQDPGNPARGLPEGTLKTRYPKTYSFFYKFKDEIKNCALFKQWFKEGRDPFYSSYNVGAYTFAPYKVLWKEVAKNIQAAVVEGANYVPDHKLVLVGLDSRDEAYYLCAILNSTPVSRFVESYSIQTSISGHIFEYVTIPTFAPDKNDTHRRLAALGKEAHGMDVQQPRPLEDVIADINDVSRGLWNLTSDEMASLNK